MIPRHWIEALRNYIDVARRVKAIVTRIDPNAKVYVFGSAVRGDAAPWSDIDILVVTERFEERHRMMAEVYREVDAPVELHVATPRLFEEWYRRFIPSNELVEV